jgi:hypothetical protein
MAHQEGERASGWKARQRRGRSTAQRYASLDEALAEYARIVGTRTIHRTTRDVFDHMAIITKLEAAHRQLMTTIRLYFDDDDLAATTHTLACAAREIYERQCVAKGLDRMFDYMASANPDPGRKELWSTLNGPRNFLKHPGDDLGLSASLELDDENECYDAVLRQVLVLSHERRGAVHTFARIAHLFRGHGLRATVNSAE